jgi:hypothetical protein
LFRRLSLSLSSLYTACCLQVEAAGEAQQAQKRARHNVIPEGRAWRAACPDGQARCSHQFSTKLHAKHFPTTAIHRYTAPSTHNAPQPISDSPSQHSSSLQHLSQCRSPQQRSSALVRGPSRTTARRPPSTTRQRTSQSQRRYASTLHFTAHFVLGVVGSPLGEAESHTCRIPHRAQNPLGSRS